MFNYKYDFSIVMGYYNRKNQLINTLNMFENKYKNYNYEVIIVDDNSIDNHKLNDISSNYTFPLTIIEISSFEKGNRINPCVVYNKGFRIARGKYVIIQNPECIHVGDLLNFIKNNLTEKDYMAFSCYNTNSQELAENLLNNLNLINDSNFRNINKKNGMEWYNHPKIRPVYYHFCAAMYNDNLKLLGGFDEEFSKGSWFDDNEILLSIRKNLKLNIKCIDPNAGFVIHQWHARDAEFKYSKVENNRMIELNKKLYETYVRKHNEYKFNYPKLLHLYWDGSNFSYLNLLTVLSFNKHHFGWKINIYCPINPVKNKSWSGSEQKTEYIGKNYFDQLKNINNVFIHYIDFNNLPFKFQDASEVIKSDFFRLYVLNKFGGLWSDFDIVYVNNIEEYYHKKELNTEKNVVLYRYLWKEVNRNIYPVGLFLCNSNNSIFNVILNNIHLFYNKSEYQCLGCNMFHVLFSSEQGKPIIVNMKLSEIFIDDANCYLPIKWNETSLLFNDKNIKKEQYQNNKDIIGIHWFNGGKESKDYCNKLDKNISNNNLENECLMDKFVKEYYK